MHGGFGLPAARESTSETPAHCSSAIRRYRLSFQCHVSIVTFFILCGFSLVPISPCHRPVRRYRLLTSVFVYPRSGYLV